MYIAFVHLFVQVLELLWNLAHRDDCPTDTMDHALNAHIKILDYSCSQVSYPHVLCCVVYVPSFVLIPTKKINHLKLFLRECLNWYVSKYKCFYY